MKTWFLGMVLTVATVAMSHGQAWITPGNPENVNLSSSATSGGVYWIDADGPGASAPVIMDYNVNNDWIYLNINLFAGPNAGSLTLIYTSIGADLTGFSYGYFTTGNPGQFFDINSPLLTVSDVPGGGTVYLRQQVWFGSDPDFATAMSSGAPFAQVDWLNPSGGAGMPPSLPEFFGGMPATILTSPIPEPGTAWLMGLGLAWLVTARRRN